MSERIWFITGASRGFGRSSTRAALAAGDCVAGTARDRSSLDDLAAEHGDAILPIALDVTDRDNPPFRLLLGNVAYDVAVDRYRSRLEEFHVGERVARGADDR